jgi:hypothetical protein
MEKNQRILFRERYSFIFYSDMSMAIIPEQTHHAQKTVLRSLRLISEQTARKSLSQKGAPALPESSESVISSHPCHPDADENSRSENC